jgi:hypothetical protein
MIVMMPDVAQEKGTFRHLREICRFFEGSGVLRRPPSVEMAAMIAAKARTAPAAVYTLGCFVVQPLGVDTQTLQQEGRPFADGIASMADQLLQEILMAEEWVGWPCCFKDLNEAKLSFAGHDYSG